MPHPSRPQRVLAAAALAWTAVPAVAQPAQATPARSEQLYESHCGACHATLPNWPDRRAASDWPSLKEAVRRWQRQLGLGWSEADIVEMSRYLNQRYYHHAPGDEAGTPPAAERRAGD